MATKCLIWCEDMTEGLMCTHSRWITPVLHYWTQIMIITYWQFHWKISLLYQCKGYSYIAQCTAGWEMPACSHQANLDVKSNRIFVSIDASITTSLPLQNGSRPTRKEQKLWPKGQTLHRRDSQSDFSKTRTMTSRSWTLM